MRLGEEEWVSIPTFLALATPDVWLLSQRGTQTMTSRQLFAPTRMLAWALGAKAAASPLRHDGVRVFRCPQRQLTGYILITVGDRLRLVHEPDGAEAAGRLTPGVELGDRELASWLDHVDDRITRVNVLRRSPLAHAMPSRRSMGRPDQFLQTVIECSPTLASMLANASRRKLAELTGIDPEWLAAFEAGRAQLTRAQRAQAPPVRRPDRGELADATDGERLFLYAHVVTLILGGSVARARGRAPWRLKYGPYGLMIGLCYDGRLVQLGGGGGGSPPQRSEGDAATGG